MMNRTASIREACVRARGGPRGGERSTYVVASIWDVHVPDHDERALDAVIAWIEDTKPDCLVIGGDFGEMESMSQHGGGRLPLAIDDIRSMRSLLRRLRSAMAEREIIYLEGNHETRFTRKVIAHLAELDGLNSVPDLLGLRELDIDWRPYKQLWAPELPSGVVGALNYTHGEWTNQHHAAKHLNVYGVNVRYGHTHKPQVFTRGYADGRLCVALGSPCLRTLDPDWIGPASGWIHGFGVDEFMPDGTFTSHNVLMVNRRFAWNGKVYG